MALFLALLSTKILVEPVNIRAKSLCSAGSFFKVFGELQVLCISTFPAVQTVGVLTWENPRAPPWHGTDLLRITGTSSEKGMVSFLGFACCHPSEYRLSVKPGAGNGTKRVKMVRLSHWVSTSERFYHICPILKKAVVQATDLALLSCHLLWGDDGPRLACLPACSPETDWGRAERWRKIGSRRTTCEQVKPRLETELL